MSIGAFGDLDLNLLSEALARPGMDPRVWVSYGLVAPETADHKSVEFDAPWGPTVWVVLQPHRQIVACRVAGHVAGNGEGEWAPFLAGDEVLVVVPEGDTRAVPVIVGRLNNELDVFPEYVAGQKTDSNLFSFRRQLGSYLIEGDSAIILRSAGTGAMIGIDETGNLTLRNGDGTVFKLGATGSAMMNADGDLQLALDTDEKSVNMMAGGSGFKLASSGPSSMMTASTLELSACGASAAEHLVTLEQLINILSLVVTLPTPGSSDFSGIFIPTGYTSRAAAVVALTAMLTIAAPLPFTPTDLAAIRAALGLQYKPPATQLGQLIPGVGCAGLLGG